MVAWVQDEPAAPAVEGFLQDADSGNIDLLMSWLNVAETFYILAKRKSPHVAEEFLRRLPSLPIRIVLPDEDAIMRGADQSRTCGRIWGCFRDRARAG